MPLGGRCLHHHQTACRSYFVNESRGRRTEAGSEGRRQVRADECGYDERTDDEHFEHSCRMPSASREQTRTGPNLRVVHLSRPHRHFGPVITRARRSLRWTRSRFAPALVWDAADRATVPKVSAFLPSPLTEALVHLAKLADRSVSAEIRQAVRAYLRSTDRPLRTGATPTPRRAYRRAYLERAKSSICSDVRSQAGQPRSARCAATTRRVRRSRRRLPAPGGRVPHASIQLSRMARTGAGLTFAGF